MTNISFPLQFIIPALLSLLILGILLLKRKRLFNAGGWKWFWISVAVFFSIYFLIVSSAAYQGISYQIALQKFDLDGDGFFSGEEITKEQQEAMYRLTSDTGRNLSIFTGLVFSGMISLVVFTAGKILEYRKK